MTLKVSCRHWHTSLQDDAILRTEGTGDVRNHSNNSLSMSNTRQQSHTSGSGPISLSESPAHTEFLHRETDYSYINMHK